MARPVEMRSSYENDVGFLMRLSRAIALDRMQPESWRNEVQTAIQNLTQSLLEANKRRYNR